MFPMQRIQGRPLSFQHRINTQVLSGGFTKYENSEEDGNECQRESDDNVCIYSPKIRVIHTSFFSNSNDIHKHNVPSTISIVNINILESALSPEKFGTIKTAVYHAADKLTLKPERALSPAFVFFGDTITLTRYTVSKRYFLSMRLVS